MKYVLYIITLFILVGLSQLLALELPVFGAAAIFWLLLALFAAARNDSTAAVAVAFIGGLIYDLTTSAPVGSYTIGALIAVSVAYTIFNRMTTLRFDWKYVPPLALGGSIFIMLWMFGYGWLLETLRLSPFDQGFTQMLLDTGALILATAIFMYPAYWLTTVLWKAIARLETRKKGGT